MSTTPTMYFFFALLLDRRRGTLALEIYLNRLPVFYKDETLGTQNITSDDEQFRKDIEQLRELAPHATAELCSMLRGQDHMTVMQILQKPSASARSLMQEVVEMWETIRTDL
jgi:hypothetical protein